MSESMRALAGTTRSVASGCTLLLRGLERSPVPDPLIVERLEVAARSAQDATPSAMGFEPGPGGVEAAGPELEDDVLAQALTDLTVGTALLAAGHAVGEGDAPPDPAALQQALAELDSVAGALDAGASRADEVRLGFEAVEPSADAAQAKGRLAVELDSALEAMTTACAGVVTDALKHALKVAPSNLQELVSQLGKKWEIGGRVGRFVGMGLAAVERGLDALTRLFPFELLRSIRDDIGTLAARLRAGEATPAVLGWAIGVDQVRADAARWSQDRDGRIDLLDRAVAALRELVERFAGLATFAARIVGAIAGATAVIGALGIAVPHLAGLAGGAFLLVMAGVVLLGLDYTDARGTPGFVVGARSIVKDAWGAT